MDSLIAAQAAPYQPADLKTLQILSDGFFGKSGRIRWFIENIPGHQEKLWR
jgi:hypothetical protein